MFVTVGYGTSKPLPAYVRKSSTTDIQQASKACIICKHSMRSTKTTFSWKSAISANHQGDPRIQVGR